MLEFRLTLDRTIESRNDVMRRFSRRSIGPAGESRGSAHLIPSPPPSTSLPPASWSGICMFIPEARQPRKLLAIFLSPWLTFEQKRRGHPRSLAVSGWRPTRQRKNLSISET